MTRRARESVPGILISRIGGFVIFLILLGILNLIAGSYRGEIFLEVVGFLNANLGLLVLITAVFLVADLFGALQFPLNLPAPLVNAAAAVFLVEFLIRLFGLVAEISGVRVFLLFEEFSFLIYPAVFLIVLIGGYAVLFTSAGEKSGRDGGDTRSWDEIGEDFRKVFTEILQKLREEFGGK
ncbi:hypothetical protein [Methanoculleus frigidifontis]|uniref:hypothetical protein n=1 Tax=Methanoculleus frigidifontis TaxID=2584085 RepID=UPI0026586740|nr:hypothetical protein [Methanoculleus sp. FWC-SCC1]